VRANELLKSQKGEEMNLLRIIGEGLQDIFPGMPDIALKLESQLDEIPDWDSMASVNFQMFLQDRFGVAIPNDFLTGERTVGEIIDLIGEQKKAA
jgi:acyl carrier protein